MSNQHQDMETIVNALLRQIKQQPIKTDIQQPSWVEKHFGVPKSGEEVLWRLSWLVAIPGIITLILIPIVTWLFVNGFPMIPILFIVGGLFIYWLVYQFAVNAAGKLQTLVEIQFCIPVSVSFFIVCYEVLKHG